MTSLDVSEQQISAPISTGIKFLRHFISCHCYWSSLWVSYVRENKPTFLIFCKGFVMNGTSDFHELYWNFKCAFRILPRPFPMQWHISAGRMPEVSKHLRSVRVRTIGGQWGGNLHCAHKDLEIHPSLWPIKHFSFLCPTRRVTETFCKYTQFKTKFYIKPKKSKYISIATTDSLLLTS